MAATPISLRCPLPGADSKFCRTKPAPPKAPAPVQPELTLRGRRLSLSPEQPDALRGSGLSKEGRLLGRAAQLLGEVFTPRGTRYSPLPPSSLLRLDLFRSARRTSC